MGLAFSPDDERLAAFATDGKLLIFDAGATASEFGRGTGAGDERAVPMGGAPRPCLA